MNTDMSAKEKIKELMDKARLAQKIAYSYDQAKVDELVAAIGYEISFNEKLISDIAEMAHNETGLGDVPSKKAKLVSKGRQMWYDLKSVKSVGVIEEIPEKGLMRIAKPVGVIGSLVPSTQPEQHPVIQSMNAVKARDAIIFSPHPRGKKTTFRMCEVIRKVLEKYDGLPDLVQCIDEPSFELTNELMKQSDLVIATGGHDMVKSAYSSGTPAFGVGAGNANIIIDKTADLKDAAVKIKASKTFDLAAGCSCDNSVIIHEDVYDDMLKAFQEVGAYLVGTEDKEKLKKAIWPEWPANHIINRHIVASPIQNIANIAGIKVPEEASIILVEETGSGIDYPFSGEKMCLVITIYKARDIDDAISILNKNLAYSGAGHSCGVYSKTPENIDKVAFNTLTTRVVVNQPQALTNTGGWTNGMPFTSSLGCGTWGGNICSENITLKHYMNNTWVIREIPNHKPTDKNLFEGFKPRL